MGSFQQFLNDQKIDPRTLVRLSARLERHSDEDRLLEHKRWAKRRDKDTQGKSYAELGLGKPKSGRGVSDRQLHAALSDQPLPPRVRGKIVRAVNALLTQKGAQPIVPAALFGDIKPRQNAPAKAS
ncbi:hypothetical protein [Stigmatella aurantiaca]|uniref:Conserved uncharacterized protein n=1 Tax=Stigmatella aurantiaca (strain DW4/3-1) TaxID=378806 RepID=Q08QD9_STIAD|nr:hypothetical protein [Stigmatella aurantiaca]ADO72938.1 conserved uncharacterized protein [Stigmatella aurantiaca DW4/3-1]EAU62704.1 hypothetical protein STIAU_7221 [Stigmatella aurantiaca DW4/3-1]